MFWVFTVLFTIIGVCASFVILTILYKKHINSWFEQDTLMIYAFNGMPHCKVYWDLKFSILRHAVVFLVAAVIFYYSDVSWLIRIFLYGYSFYTTTTLLRYWYRKDIIKSNIAEGRLALADSLKNPLKASMVVVFFSVCANISLFILYAIRP